ncbi:hypothetical protein EIP91_003710 [Steccherinum ochraceum]|uniref:Cytochrome P450-dit2 n=1 Tax=Steccherinum ochraceum TaxID=92696 RepID=A0A4R0S063_9APHY|nr:hypothetical protein EIP91_003710 [Steccherinum ochraceum]
MASRFTFDDGLSLFAGGLCGLFAAWITWSWIYNLWFHPLALAGFPGPKIATGSLWWKRWHYNVTRDHIPALFELHAKYGSVVRVAPNELHFSDPDAYGELYSPNRRWLKQENLYGKLVEGESTWNFLDYPSAKKRREVLLSHFSRKSVIELQYLVQDRLDILCDAIAQNDLYGKPSDFTHAFRCFALDTITSVCFAKPVEATRAPGLKSPMMISMDKALPILQLFVHFPIVRWIASKIPPDTMVAMHKSMKGYGQFRKMLADQIREILADPSVLTNAPHPIIYHSLLNFNPAKSAASQTATTNAEQLSFVDLNEEAFVLVFAGADTGSNAVLCGVVHSIENRRIYKKLKEELLSVWPVLEDKPRYEVLEKLPYLTAVVKESLRMSHGIVSPPLRIVPPEGATIAGHAIPGGTFVGMSSCFVHWSESIFPDARKFNPERWLTPESKNLEQYLVAFSKGPRSCVGINLGYCELYLAIANVFRRFDMELDGVSTADFRWVDYYLPFHVGPDMTVRAKPVSA